MSDSTDIGIEPAHTDAPTPSPVLLEDIQGNLPTRLWKRVGRIIEVKIVDDATAITTGEGKLIFCIPASLDGSVLRDAQAFVTTVSSANNPAIGIRNVTNAAEILSTTITIDANETTSYTAVTPSVIDPTQNIFKKGDLISVDVDTAGTGAKGLGVILEIQ